MEIVAVGVLQKCVARVIHDSVVTSYGGQREWTTSNYCRGFQAFFGIGMDFCWLATPLERDVTSHLFMERDVTADCSWAR